MVKWTGRRAVACSALVLAAAGCTNVPVTFGTEGILTDKAGMTLYTFDKDTPGSGKSVCNGPCATNWPPLLAGSGPRPGGYWSVITRDDGAGQWAYEGKPVYYWAKDRKPGDRTGDGVNNVWHIIKADPPPPPIDP